MTKAGMDALQVRLDMLVLALAALARAVPAELAAAVQDGLRREVEQRLEGRALSPQADEAVAADMACLMNALDVRGA